MLKHGQIPCLSYPDGEVLQAESRKVESTLNMRAVQLQAQKTVQKTQPYEDPSSLVLEAVES